MQRKLLERQHRPLVNCSWRHAVAYSSSRAPVALSGAVARHCPPPHNGGAELDYQLHCPGVPLGTPQRRHLHLAVAVDGPFPPTPPAFHLDQSVASLPRMHLERQLWAGQRSQLLNSVRPRGAFLDNVRPLGHLPLQLLTALLQHNGGADASRLCCPPLMGDSAPLSLQKNGDALERSDQLCCCPRHCKHHYCRKPRLSWKLPR